MSAGSTLHTKIIKNLLLQQELRFPSFTLTHTKADVRSVPYWSKFFQGVYEVGLHHRFTQASDMNHWAGRDAMGVFSIVLKHSVDSRGRVRTASSPVTFRESWN